MTSRIPSESLDNLYFRSLFFNQLSGFQLWVVPKLLDMDHSMSLQQILNTYLQCEEFHLLSLIDKTGVKSILTYRASYYTLNPNQKSWQPISTGQFKDYFLQEDANWKENEMAVKGVMTEAVMQRMGFFGL